MYRRKKKSKYSNALEAIREQIARAEEELNDIYDLKANNCDKIISTKTNKTHSLDDVILRKEQLQEKLRNLYLDECLLISEPDFYFD